MFFIVFYGKLILWYFYDDTKDILFGTSVNGVCEHVYYKIHGSIVNHTYVSVAVHL